MNPALGAHLDGTKPVWSAFWSKTVFASLLGGPSRARCLKACESAGLAKAIYLLQGTWQQRVMLRDIGDPIW